MIFPGASLRAVEAQLPSTEEKSRPVPQPSAQRGGECQAEVSTFFPIVNRNACEGKGDCVEVCPYDVFEVRRIDDQEFSKLSFVGKLKSSFRGRLSAYTPGADLCRACGLCVAACPEKAITLVSARAWLGWDII